jgi:hypothetical protein
MPLKKQKFSIIQDDLSKAIDIDDSVGRSCPVNMNFTETGYLTKDTGFSLFGASESTNKVHSIFNFEKKDGTSQFLGIRSTKVVKYNTSTSLWEDTTKTVTADKRMTWIVDSAGDILYACNATDAMFSYNGTTFTDIASAPKGNILEIFEDRLYVAGVTAEPRTVYYSNTGALTTWTGTDVFKPLGTDKITALENYYGFLLVFKEKTIWKITRIYESVSSTWIHKQELQSGNYGACSIQSVVWVENDLWFFTGNREVRAFGFKDQQTGVLGINESVISEQIKETLKNIPDTNLPSVVCHYNNRRFYLGISTNQNSTLNDILFVCHNLYGNNWTKYTNRDKAKSEQLYSINKVVYSVKNTAPYAILKWDDSLLDDNNMAITGSVTFKKIEDKDFNLFNIYRYIDLMFKNLQGKILVTVYSDKSDVRLSKSKSFYIGLTAEDELGSLGETPFGQALWGDSFGEEGAVSPFIKRRISLLSKAQTLTIKLESSDLSGTFTIAQFAVYGFKQNKETFPSGGIVSIK